MYVGWCKRVWKLFLRWKNNDYGVKMAKMSEGFDQEAMGDEPSKDGKILQMLLTDTL